MKTPYRTTPPDATGMPRGIPYIVGNEAAERFSFYGMRAILFVFMTKHLLDSTGAAATMGEAEATSWQHAFVASAYFFPILGAIVSDWLFGKYLTILSLSLVYCAGHGVLALIDSSIASAVEPRSLLMLGLLLIAIGAGGIKPCVSAHVGDQFGERNKHLIPRVYRWFYFAINFGSAISTILTPYLLLHFGPGWAFGVPGLLMAVATLVFWMGRHKFVHIPPARGRFFRETFSAKGLRAAFNLIPLFVLVAPFWSLFDQTQSRWVSQSMKMNRVLVDGKIFGQAIHWEPLPSEIQAANPFLILILIPVFSYFIYPLLGRFFNVTPLRRIGIGLVLTVPAFAISAWIQTSIDGGAAPHLGWQLFAYVLMTAAEVMVSITCLEFAYTQAPRAMKSFIMGLYLLSVSLGNVVTSVVNKYIDVQQKKGIAVLEGATYYWFFTGLIAATAIVFVIWSQSYRGATYIQRGGGVSE